MPVTRQPGGTSTVLAAVAAPTWKTRGISRRGAHARYRVNTALRRARDVSLFPVRIEVAVRLTEPSYNGLPTAAEQQRLAGIEETLLSVVAARGVLAGVLTSVGVCRFFFYAASADWAGEIEPALQQAAGQVAVRATADPSWQAYRTLLRTARRSYVVGLSVLCLFPFLNGALALSAYGPAWGVAAFAAPVVVAAIVFRLRSKGGQWYLARATAMFSLYAALIGAILFGIVAHVGRGLGLPAWGAAAACLVIGAGLIALVWPAQRRFWRDRQTPAGDIAAGQR